MLTAIFALLSEISVIAQVKIDSTLSIFDSCSIYLNRSENIESFRSQTVTINKDQLSAGYSLNILSTLSGKINGADIKTANSGNSASSVFFMRGDRNLISDSQPLYVVDGVPVLGNLNSNLGFDYGNLLNDWNIDDIESVSILKGGQASLLYGNRAGNGAVIIRTKKADAEGFHVEYSISAIMRRIADSPEFQNSYGQGYNGEFSYSDGIGGGINDGMDGSWGPRFNGQLIPQFDGLSTGYINGTSQQVRGGDTWARQQAGQQGIDNSIKPTPWIAQPNNLKDYFQTAYTLANNIGLSWANKQGGFRMSYTNVRADDVTPNTHFVKNTFGGNFNYTFFNKLKIYGTLQRTNQKDMNLLLADDPYMQSPMVYFAWMGRQVNTRNLKNYWQAGQENIAQFNYLNTYSDNPFFAAFENESPLERKNFFGSVGAKFEIVKGFSINYTGGFNKVDQSVEKTMAQGNLSGKPANVKSENITQSIYRHSFFADYAFKLGSMNDLSVFSGLYFEKADGNERFTLGSGYPGENSTNLKTNGYFGGISYVGHNAYSLKVMMSRDTYKLIEKLSTPLLYSVSGSVEIEKLLSLPKVISTLNVQTGYSTSGLNTLPVINLTSLPSEQNHFSVNSEYTVSADLGFFNNRILGHVNYYTSHTENGMLDISISSNNGYSSRIISTASVKNSGYEISLDIIPVHSQKICWKSSILYFKNRNEVVDLADGIASTSMLIGSVEMRNEKGQPMGNLFGRKFKRREGQLVFKNGLPEYTNMKELLGNVNPDYMIYSNNSLTFKKLTISLSLEYSKGGVCYSPFYKFGTLAGTLANTADREAGVVGDGVKWDDAGGTYVKNDINVSAEDYYEGISGIEENSIMDATYLKLKEINVSYSFMLKQKLNMTCSIFGQNIYTWSRSKDYNNSNLFKYNNIYHRGINNYNLPETYVLGMKIQLHI